MWFEKVPVGEAPWWSDDKIAVASAPKGASASRAPSRQQPPAPPPPSRSAHASRPTSTPASRATTATRSSAAPVRQSVDGRSVLKEVLEGGGRSTTTDAPLQESTLKFLVAGEKQLASPASVAPTRIQHTHSNSSSVVPPSIPESKTLSRPVTTLKSKRERPLHRYSYEI